MWGKWEKLSSTAGRAILAKPAQHADAPHAFGLLRPRRERPRSRAAEQRDELAAFDLRTHSITSSARASSVGGTSRPSALGRPPSPREAYDFVHHAPQLRNRCLLNQGGFKTRPYESTSSNRC